MKRKVWIITGVAVLAFGGVLSLFEDDSDTAEAKSPKPSATPPTEPAGKPQPAKEAPGPTGIPSPDTTQTEALIRALRTIEPGLVEKQKRAVDRSRNVCQDMKGGKDAATVQSNAKARFEGGAVPSLTDEQAGQIVTAVRSSFCG
ncbi:hypothetical protein [Streptomyces sp. URMC 123]|uniref:DUF732 domain-containing protein n=1 Tax=Streptomyces sp. URMC 123 TaxID=3423403 RepID=UPI003F1E3A26